MDDQQPPLLALGAGQPSGAPTISVVCPAYNSREFVTKTLLTVLQQDLAPAELIVIDDGSTDGTAEVVEEYLRDCPFPARVIRCRHGGAGFARNVGIRAATSEWVAFLDSDDLWTEGKLATLAAVIRTCPDRNFICHQMELLGLGGIVRSMHLMHPLRLDESLAAQLFYRNFFTPSAVICRRQLLQDVGPFDSSLLVAQDYDLWIRMAPYMKPICLVAILGTYRQRSGSISSRNYFSRVRNVLGIFKRHRRMVSVGLYATASIRYLVGSLLIIFIRGLRGSCAFLPNGVPTQLPDNRSNFVSYTFAHKTLRTLVGKTALAPLRGKLRSSSNLRVLMFHNVLWEEQEQFALLMRSLKSRGVFIDVDTYEEMVAGERPIVGENYLLTFDDGFKSNKRVADEVLDSEGIKALFFVPTQFIGMRDRRTIGEFIAYRIFDGSCEESIGAEYDPMSWEDLAALLEAGHSLGSHTVSHARINTLGRSELAFELAESKNTMRRRLGIEPNHFAYPFGTVGSVGEGALQTALNHYSYVHSAVRGRNQAGNGRVVFREGFASTENLNFVNAVLAGGLDLRYWGARKKLNRWAAGVPAAGVGPR